MLVANSDAEAFYHVPVLWGPMMLAEHCVLKHVGGEVTLQPSHGAFITINNRQVIRPVKLSQGQQQILHIRLH